jgi:hypothetical protein
LIGSCRVGSNLLIDCEVDWFFWTGPIVNL